MSASVKDLEARIAERDATVAALTMRLEQAAEQLDRVQRLGPQGRSGRGDSTAAAVDLRGIETALDGFRGADCHASLGRLEMQLAELRDLVASGVSVAGPDYAPTTDYSASAVVSPAEPEDAAAAPSEPAADDGVDWAAMKARLLGVPVEELAEETRPEVEAVESEVAEADEIPAESEETPRESTSPDDLVAADAELDPIFKQPIEPPAPFDAEQADADLLRAAVEERDAFISELLGRYRKLIQAGRPIDRWADLAAVPAGLTDRLKGLELRLTQALRATEVELSLERAKLGREWARIRQAEPVAPSDAGDADEQDGDRTEKRWSRILGRK